jgi:hypothetical protein
VPESPPAGDRAEDFGEEVSTPFARKLAPRALVRNPSPAARQPLHVPRSSASSCWNSSRPRGRPTRVRRGQLCRMEWSRATAIVAAVAVPALVLAFNTAGHHLAPQRQAADPAGPRAAPRTPGAIASHPGRPRRSRRVAHEAHRRPTAPAASAAAPAATSPPVGDQPTPPPLRHATRPPTPAPAASSPDPEFF